MRQVCDEKGCATEREKGDIMNTEKKKKNIPWKLVLYTLLFGFVCVISQRSQTMAPDNGWLYGFRDLTGMVVALLVLSHYRLSDFKAYWKFHLGWLVIGIAAMVIAFPLLAARAPYVNHRMVLLLVLFVWGFVLIQTICTIVKERRYPKLNKFFAGVWLVMMLLMCVSKNDELWPFFFAVMFSAFYVTDYTKEERSRMFQGLLNGLIGAFFLIQGLAFLHRPYEVYNVRYLGLFSNCNNNALFYLFPLAAVLVKLYLCRKNHARWWWHLYYWLGVGVVLSLIIFTIGRTAWITAFVMVLLFLLIQKRDWRKSIVIYGLVAVLCTALTFPLCYAAVRYIPPMRHHVVWFYGEYAPYKIHSWEPWDSEKYVKLEGFLDVAFGRVVTSLEGIIKRLPFVIEADAADRDAIVEEFYANSLPIFESYELIGDGYNVRASIYKHFLGKLNMFGHIEEEVDVMLYPDAWLGHTHNIYLQYGMLFGIPVMLLFIFLTFGGLMKGWRMLKRTKNPEYMAYFYMILIPALFGMFELTYGYGHMAITLLFVAWRMLLVQENLEENYVELSAEEEYVKPLKVEESHFEEIDDEAMDLEDMVSEEALEEFKIEEFKIE